MDRAVDLPGCILCVAELHPTAATQRGPRRTCVHGGLGATAESPVVEAATIAGPPGEGGRCLWSLAHPLLTAYHDEEWGRPVVDSRALWEKLMLDGMQAGLSWLTVLKKRAALRRAFVDFVPARVAAFGEADVARLLQDASIIRSRSKIQAVVGNARAYLQMVAAGEDLAELAWAAVGHSPAGGDGSGAAPRSPYGDALAKQLRARHYTYVGPTIVHAWLQATGLVNGHVPTCSPGSLPGVRRHLPSVARRSSF